MKKICAIFFTLLICFTMKYSFAVDSSNLEKQEAKIQATSYSNEITPGIYEIYSYSNDTMVVSAENYKNNGANIFLNSRKNENSQKFELVLNEDGSYTFIAQHSKKVIDVQNAGMDFGTNVWQYDQNGSNAQRWFLQPCGDGFYNIISKLNGQYLDIKDGIVSDGQNIQIFYRNGTNAQKFRFVKVLDTSNSGQVIKNGIYKIHPKSDQNYSIEIKNHNNQSAVYTTLGVSKNNLDANQKIKLIYNNDGTYNIQFLHSEKVLDVQDADTKNRTKVWQYDFNNSDAQKWIINKNSDDSYTIISKCSNLVLDIENGNISNGSGIQTYEYNGSNAQKFIFEECNEIQGTQNLKDSTYRIASCVSYNQVLDISGGFYDNGINLQVWQNDGVSQQRFNIEYIGDGYYKIKAKHSNKALTVQNENPIPGSKITQEEDKGLETQKWILKKIDNNVYNIVSKCGNLYLDIPYYDTSNGKHIQLYTQNDSSAQQFFFIDDNPDIVSNIDDGIYQIVLKNNMTLDIDGGKYDDYANVQIWHNDQVPQQKFRIQRVSGTNYYEIINVNSGKLLDVQNGNTDIGANVDQFQRNYTNSQYWYFDNCGNGYYNIISKASGLCIDISGGMTTNNGTNVQLYYSNNSDAQQFKLEHVNIVESGTYEIETKLNSNMVVDVAGGSYDNGANIQIWTADNVNQQKFILEPQSDDVYVIRAKHSNKALTVDLSNNNVCQMDYTGASNQQWRIQEAGYEYYNLISLANNLYLDVSNGNAQNGQNIQVYSDNESDAQQFRFVTGYRKFYEEGTYGTSGKRQSGQGGYDLTYYKIGKGSKHLFTTFSIHGFEDSYWKDGSELTYMANQLKDYLYNNLSEDLINEWTIYIFPTLNPDGQYDGWTNNGPGRTTVYSYAPNNQGIDMNRGFSVGFQRMTSARNYTGTEAFQAPEAAQLRDFILAHQGSSNVLIDVHGWLNETIGDDGIGSYYRSEFGISKHIGTYGNGYLVNWARSIPNTRSMLLELPNVTSHAQVVNWDYAGKFNRATMRLLNDF